VAKEELSLRKQAVRNYRHRESPRPDQSPLAHKGKGNVVRWGTGGTKKTDLLKLGREKKKSTNESDDPSEPGDWSSEEKVQGGGKEI